MLAKAYGLDNVELGLLEGSPQYVTSKVLARIGKLSGGIGLCMILLQVSQIAESFARVPSVSQSIIPPAGFRTAQHFRR